MWLHFTPGIGIKTIFSQHYLGMLSLLFRLFWTNGSYEEDFQRFLSFLIQKIYPIPLGSLTYHEARDVTNIGCTLPEDVSANVLAFLAKWFFRKSFEQFVYSFCYKNHPPPPIVAPSLASGIMIWRNEPHYMRMFPHKFQLSGNTFWEAESKICFTIYSNVKKFTPHPTTTTKNGPAISLWIMGSFFEQTWIYTTRWCFHISLSFFGKMIFEKEAFKNN